MNSKGRRRRPGSKSLAQVLKCDDEAFVDFIAKCLIFDPDRRYVSGLLEELCFICGDKAHSFPFLFFKTA